MLVNGKEIAEDILAQVKKEAAARPSGAPRLTAVTCQPNFETRKYLALKKRRAAEAGIVLNVVELPPEIDTDEAVFTVAKLAEKTDGLVVQLPLPDHFDRKRILAAVPPEKDPDGFAYGKNKMACLPPVTGAIDEIANRYGVKWRDREVVILGSGVLVGQPAALYAKEKGAKVTVLTKDNFNPALLRLADLIITGIGQPHFVVPDMVKEGVVIFDAGTAEDGGKIAGDVDPKTYAKASLVTPVPGGIGPITIAYLLRNLMYISSQ